MFSSKHAHMGPLMVSVGLFGKVSVGKVHIDPFSALCTLAPFWLLAVRPSMGSFKAGPEVDHSSMGPTHTSNFTKM